MKEIGKIKKAYKYLKKRVSIVPETIVVLGSGLGAVIDDMEGAKAFSFGEIPHIKKSTTPYHDGKLIFGKLSGKSVGVMKGRIHLYEDNTPNDVVRLIRVLALLGAKRVILTNSAGAINASYNVGDIVQIVDHVSLFVPSPLRGEIRREIGTKLDFTDMTKVYDGKIIEKSRDVAKKLNMDLKSGVYVQLFGAQYETPAEIKLLKGLNCDLVGMSTVVEAIASRHLGLEVCAFSTVTNMASGIEDVNLCHEEVKSVATKASTKLKDFIKRLIENLD